jgi:hypothetical protein
MEGAIEWENFAHVLSVFIFQLNMKTDICCSNVNTYVRGIGGMIGEV